MCDEASSRRSPERAGPMNRFAAVAAILVTALVALAAPPALADEVRYALVVAAHEGGPDETPLAHAGRDARRVSDTLVALGGFLPENVVTLVDVDAVRVRDALARLNARLRADREPGRTSLLIVYYSGHADARSLHLSGTSLPWDELRNAVSGSAAELRLLVVDACRSGAATRVKGLTATAAFALPTPTEPVAEGFAILSASTLGEDAQESDAIGGSFFTHHLVGGLIGGADANADARVTLDEAYAYARDRTVASTATTVAGAQHPTFRYDLKGRADVVLTSLAPSRVVGRVRLPGAGRYFFHRGDDADAPLAAELKSPGGDARVTLAPGRYFVRWRRPERFLEGRLDVPAGRDVRLDPAGMSRFEYARLVRKGGSDGLAGTLALFGGAAAAPLGGFGPEGHVGLVGSLDLEPVTLDLALTYATATSGDPEAAATLHGIGLLAGARKVLDVGPLSVSFGVRAGAVTLVEDYTLPTEEGPRARVAPAFEGLARAELGLGGPWLLALEGGARVLALEVRRDLDSTEARTPLVGWARLGLGMSFR
ncbi:MAG: caspase family protein [Deltaproteobacteria bacterium]|nr:MAG: caspase family protein [Deltaproteobacteria bacterium]